MNRRYYSHYTKAALLDWLETRKATVEYRSGLPGNNRWLVRIGSEYIVTGESLVDVLTAALKKEITEIFKGFNKDDFEKSSRTSE